MFVCLSGDISVIDYINISSVGPTHLSSQIETNDKFSDPGYLQASDQLFLNNYERLSQLIEITTLLTLRENKHNAEL